ncbi:bifunctional 2-C-methyl-D-erythritol 4-phosphate cytidylyltransferase/2-C-methyl-D-erythritol 2,4-cyclodiphosphate synthase [Luteithermobacter gelatinilyticus]|uniref:bifunctional 2-C-methyl-D-erythritol 4-phosphate cytidylyltransferase/2-C-methyl-D-erythritol 2,4-cyclodiphosphate synthase n=1 Tax=Luteithermobacter gelatinilyticus TaxID=2582913 RepID=UPI001106BE3A|nr:bifunctional 2-C-methyl-D-erythritol 4-phosphate cytidylyltransferase/2-C-methyl-D-erythritol 2,4-cyclodiphosphate synthase [Luteithermobacter gelatinilyticus]
MKIAAVIVAAGRGHRLGEKMPKQYLPLAGKTILRRTAEVFAAHDAISLIQVVIHPDDLSLYQQSITGLDLPPPVFGGTSRQESVRYGLQALKEHRPDLVLIHDAARPFLSHELVNRVIAAARDHGAALPALAVTDTLKRARDKTVEATIDRNHLWRAQTPQAFRFDLILDSHDKLVTHNLTDDAALVESMGHPVHIVTGEERNFKITTAEDLAKAERMMRSNLTDVRTGYGFDVHAFESKGEAVILGGISIPFDKKLKGHSDADVALHALTDAILGAIAAGDIGDHFPPGEDRWKGAPSKIFLKEAMRLVSEKGGIIAHLDLTLICEAPKIGPHREAMRQSIASICGLDLSRISIKATTTEKLGFTGRAEGIAAQAVATVRLPEECP